MESNPLVERWADGEPTLIRAPGLPDVPTRIDAWLHDAATAAEGGLEGLVPGATVGWFTAADVAGRRRALDLGLAGVVIELDGGSEAVAAAVDDCRYAPEGTRPWVVPDPAPVDPVRFRAVANEMLAVLVAVAEPAHTELVPVLAELEGIDGIVVADGGAGVTGELEDVVIDVCDDLGLTPGLAFCAEEPSAVTERRVEQAHLLGFGVVIVRDSPPASRRG